VSASATGPKHRKCCTDRKMIKCLKLKSLAACIHQFSTISVLVNLSVQTHNGIFRLLWLVFGKKLGWVGLVTIGGGHIMRRTLSVCLSVHPVNVATGRAAYRAVHLGSTDSCLVLSTYFMDAYLTESNITALVLL